MFRQILISLVVLAAAAFGYVWFVPDAAETLARFGNTLPVIAASTSDAPTPEAVATPNGQRAGGQGQQTGATPAQGGQRGGGQQQTPGAAQGGQGGAQQAAPGGARQGGGAGGNRRFQRDMVVVTAPVTIASINNSLMAIGEGAAAHSVTVMSPASGTLRDLAVRPGQQIEAGAIIGRLDSEAEQIAYDRAALNKNDADAALARTLELSRANAATTVQLNAAQLAADNAALELQNAKLALDKRTITSPIGGTVGLFQVSPGNSVTAQTVVTTIEDTASIVVSFWVPERYATAVTIGLPVAAAAVALPGEDLSGEVIAVDNRIDPASRTMKVEAEFPNEDLRLRPGMSFAVEMAFDGESFPSVDPLSIQWSSEGSYVWKHADGKVSKVEVEIIQRNSNGVLVKGDLTDQDWVVTQGVQQLAEGAQVRLLDDLLSASPQRPNKEGQS